MDLSAITSLSGLSGTSGLNYSDKVSALTTKLEEKTGLADGTMFDAILNTAIDNIRTANSYLSDAENEKIKFALGETENTHDLTIAMQKASTALQYTVAIRDKLLDAYKELMQMQI
ncbi:MAG: flagellar hook-basal body complex protein FliE [Clostridium sp.]|nr:flagellar hook-basal body complex protein FliE [Acetatifactor muris]MCM1526021.1 flagellar hook-basal body complex protein FliE [Bacteroides sp.]MCM1562219.1 flagellar hook-basal body complex protein FliE [Clostridium sp.]